MKKKSFRTEREFGLIVGGIFVLLSSWWIYRGKFPSVRYVTLPFEAHGYAGRETLLHILAERINWFDKYVKNAPPRTKQQTATAN